MPLYDCIGLNYSDLRRPDPRIAAVIEAALGSAQTILNVGAGAGSYEPENRTVTAVEPSVEMMQQRTNKAAQLIVGRAEELPFEDDTFDASIAINTIHHWTDQRAGLLQMRRVTRGTVVILTFDPDHRGFWLEDYLPQLRQLDLQQMPTMKDYQAWLGPVQITPVLVPRDCLDGFLYAYWARPSAYLDQRVRQAMSSFHMIGDCTDGLAKLASDLESGRWEQRYVELLSLEQLDVGYRLVVSDIARMAN